MTASGTPASHAAATDALRVDVPFREAARVWAKIGLLSFGGPAGQIALMHRLVVEEKRWVSEARFLHALNFCMLLPGPEAQQLATYIGWLLHRVRGGLVAGTLFIVPGFFVILGLSYLYVAAGNLPLVQGLFLGLKAAVIAIVVQAVMRIASRSLQGPREALLAVLAFVAICVYRVPFPWVILGAAAVGSLAARLDQRAAGSETAMDDVAGFPAIEGADSPASWRRSIGAAGILLVLWLAPVVLLAVSGSHNVFAELGVFFSKMAVVTFGGAYAVLSYVAQETVQIRGWLTPGEMIDGLAMAETTPGPLIMVVQFVGFIAAYRHPGPLAPGIAGFLGSVLTIWVTFLPCFLWIFLGAPHVETLRRYRILGGALSAVTAAVVGVIVNLAVWFAMHFLFSEVAGRQLAGGTVELPVLASVQVPAVLATLAALLLIFRLHASVTVTLLLTGLLGMAAFGS